MLPPLLSGSAHEASCKLPCPSYLLCLHSLLPSLFICQSHSVLCQALYCCLEPLFKFLPICHVSLTLGLHAQRLPTMGMMDSPICQAFAECRSLELKPWQGAGAKAWFQSLFTEGNCHPLLHGPRLVSWLVGTLPYARAAYISSSSSKGFSKQPLEVAN